MTTGRFHGAFTALVTPFKNGKIDEEAYREFIEWQIEQGIDGLVPCGTTGSKLRGIGWNGNSPGSLGASNR